jgi:hypothetical protein
METQTPIRRPAELQVTSGVPLDNAEHATPFRDTAYILQAALNGYGVRLDRAVMSWETLEKCFRTKEAEVRAPVVLADSPDPLLAIKQPRPEMFAAFAVGPCGFLEVWMDDGAPAATIRFGHSGEEYSGYRFEASWRG